MPSSSCSQNLKPKYPRVLQQLLPTTQECYYSSGYDVIANGCFLVEQKSIEKRFDLSHWMHHVYAFECTRHYRVILSWLHSQELTTHQRSLVLCLHRLKLHVKSGGMSIDDGVRMKFSSEMINYQTGS